MLDGIDNIYASYLEAAACIISTAQQANPNVIGHIEPLMNNNNDGNYVDDDDNEDFM